MSDGDEIDPVLLRHVLHALLLAALRRQEGQPDPDRLHWRQDAQGHAVYYYHDHPWTDPMTGQPWLVEDLERSTTPP